MAKRTPLFFFPKPPRPQRFPISLNSASILEFLPLFLLLPTNHHQILRAQHAARTGPLLLFQSKPGPCSGLPAVLLFLFRPSHQPDAGRCRSGHACHFSPDYHLAWHIFPNLFGVCRPAREEAFVLSTDVTRASGKAHSYVWVSEQTAPLLTWHPLYHRQRQLIASWNSIPAPALEASGLLHDMPGSKPPPPFGPSPCSLPVLAQDYSTTFPEAAEEEGF